MADLNNITFACENPVPLSEFSAAALGYEPVEPSPERSQKIGPYDEFWTAMRDPEGNGFCVS